MAKSPLLETASQTAGPYVHIGLAPEIAELTKPLTPLGQSIAGPRVSGERILVRGIIFDGAQDPVTDAMLEIWQADAEGRHAGDDGCAPEFRGWGRVAADFDTGLWHFETIKPGRVGARAPHIALWIVARGINIGLHTRLYFDDETEANEADPVLQSVPDSRKAATLMAQKERDGVYRFDIRLQGPGETVFFDI